MVNRGTIAYDQASVDATYEVEPRLDWERGVSVLQDLEAEAGPLLM